MQCTDVTEQLLAADEPDIELDQHLETCQRCTHVARGVRRLDALLSTTVLVEPPLQLQWRLAQLAVEAAQPASLPWWSRLMRGQFDLSGWLVLRPHVVAAQGLAAMLLALAGWQVFGFLSTVRPVVGDVGYAMQLVAASPAMVYLGGFQLDLQSLGMWSVAGLAAWLVSDNGLLRRPLAELMSRFNVRLP
jgi:hypothetical protein